MRERARHVADFFDMTPAEQAAVLSLLNEARRRIHEKYAHVHVHLIPRYAGDVPDPRGGIRCVLRR